MTQFFYRLIDIIYRLHAWFLSLNDAHELYFSDKQLHFLVIGIFGLALVLVLQPIFTWLAKNDHVLVITWLYVFTIILVVTFAIEIGQRVGGQGTMEFADIVFGVAGFFALFLVYALIRAVVRLLVKHFKR